MQRDFCFIAFIDSETQKTLLELPRRVFFVQRKHLDPSFEIMFRDRNLHKKEIQMKQVLITISRGIIDQVIFFEDPKIAIQALSDYVKEMIPEHDDAALYDTNGLIANAKHFLDDEDEYRENDDLIKAVT